MFMLQGVAYPFFCFRVSPTCFYTSGCHLPIFMLQGVTYSFRVSPTHFSAPGCHLPVFMLQGVTYPAIHAIWAKWAPPQEKTKLATFAFAGEWVEGLHPYSVGVRAGVGAPILSGCVGRLG